jgi:hypothetical protein
LFSLFCCSSLFSFTGSIGIDKNELDEDKEELDEFEAES